MISRRAGLAMWFIFLTTLSLLPDSVKRRIGTTGVLHDVGHLLVFCFTVFILCNPKLSLVNKFLRAALVFGFALITEGLQCLIFLNYFEWRDIITDGLGVTLGILLDLRFPKAPESGVVEVRKIFRF
jgi:glycopeptide antibiotics resistance protein